MHTTSCWGFAESSREETVRLEYVVSDAAGKITACVSAADVAVGTKLFKFAKKSSWLFVVLILISPESFLGQNRLPVGFVFPSCKRRGFKGGTPLWHGCLRNAKRFVNN